MSPQPPVQAWRCSRAGGSRPGRSPPGRPAAHPRTRGDLEGAAGFNAEREGARSMDGGGSRWGRRGAERWGGGSQQGEEPDGQRRGQRQLPEAPPTPGVGLGLPQGHRPAHQCVCRAHEPLPRFANHQPVIARHASWSGSPRFTRRSRACLPETPQPTVEVTSLPGGHLGSVVPTRAQPEVESPRGPFRAGPSPTGSPWRSRRGSGPGGPRCVDRRSSWPAYRSRRRSRSPRRRR